MRDPIYLLARNPAYSDIAVRRKNDLSGMMAFNAQRGYPPCYDIHLQSKEELLWLMAIQNWSGAIDTGKKRRAKLRGVYLSGIDLTAIDLNGADLSYAHLNNTNLSHATLINASLMNADLRYANLRQTCLISANLFRADLEYADLTEASLVAANLAGAYLENATLCGTDLREGYFDIATILRNAHVDDNIRLVDIVWNGAPLSHIDWNKIKIIGDEKVIKAQRFTPGTNKSLTSPQKRRYQIDAYHKLERTYRTLAIMLREQGLADTASEYHLCEQRIGRKISFLERQWGKWAFSSVLNTVSGYGERPFRALMSYGSTIIVFAIFYFIITNNVDTHFAKLTLDESLILSVTTFHGRGFFSNSITLGDWVARVGAVEAFLGLFIELVLIATFSRRFLES